MRWWLLLILAAGGLLSCSQEHAPEISLDEFQLQDGLQIELVAAEPLLDSPVAMTFDGEGNIWVVELPGYMRDIEGSNENAPDGKIVKLSDRDGDGIMDRRQVVKDGLIAPRALALVYGGLLYTNGTSLWWESLRKKEPEKVLVDSLYVIGGNIEHQPNGLLYNLDNWIYSARSNARYRRVNGKWQKEPTTMRGQWGITHDIYGRLFYNDNSNPLFGDYVMPNVLMHNPYQKVKTGVLENIAPDRSLYPVTLAAVNRGYMDDVLGEDGRVQKTTSSCGPVIFSGTGLGPDFSENAFVCAPEANLIKRYVVKENAGAISASPAYDGTEFLTSNDETFRPVNLFNGPDGALYILDLRKGIIQHRAYMSSYLHEKVRAKKLDEVNGVGRIYRVISPEVDQINPLKFNNTTVKELVEFLGHADGAVRMMAQKELVFRKESLDISLLEQGIKSNNNALQQMHALWTLEGLELLTVTHLLSTAKNNPSPELTRQVLRLARLTSTDHDDELLAIAAKIDADAVDIEAAHLAGRSATSKYWSDLADKYENSALHVEALISGLDSSRLTEALQKINKNTLLHQALKTTITNREARNWQAPELQTERFLDNRTAGLQLFQSYCATCHGTDGKGLNNLAPPMLNSEYVSGSSDRLALILLHGLHGPIHVNGEIYDMPAVMPGLKDNPQMSDKDIADVIAYIRSTFGQVDFADMGTSAERVAALRAQTADRRDMFTEPELDAWLVENRANNASE